MAASGDGSIGDNGGDHDKLRTHPSLAYESPPNPDLSPRKSIRFIPNFCSAICSAWLGCRFQRRRKASLTACLAREDGRRSNSAAVTEIDKAR